MFKKSVLVLLTLILIALSLSCVSAQDNMTMDVTNDLKGSEPIMSDFNDLSDKINKSSEGIVYLEDDYRTTDSSSQIIISKSITIDGQNHAIEAPDVDRVFLVKADNVCIRNIHFINSKSAGLAGGVISWLGNNGSLENCSFTNSSAKSGGGAVCWMADNGRIINCNFENNNVNYGPAVSLTSGESFDPTQIYIQIVNAEGGALYLSGNNISVDSCSFYNNLAVLNGGAISINWGSNITVSSSKFKNNSAGYNGGAIDWNSENALIFNSTFENNSPENLFLNANAQIVNSTFDEKQSIESWYNVSYVNVVFNDIATFEDLALLVDMTPEGGILVLDKDYEYVNGTNKGVLISKPITIDGAGHTLNGNKLSRMFNITADNVTIKNINFIKGNAFGRYYGIAGGGAIYWSGANGLIQGCSFINNTGSGIEDDPYDKPESWVDENGTVWYIYRMRPMGTKLNEGGAIVWNGTNGTVSKCIFTGNTVGYPDYGGAICWRGDNGNVIESEFYNNGAWAGSAICWMGDNGTVLSSVIANSSFFDGGLFWFGNNGSVHNSLLIDANSRGALRTYYVEVNADYNFWGDTVENPNSVIKGGNVSKWIVMKFSNNGKFVKKGEKVIIKYDITTLIDKKGKKSYYPGLINYSSQMTYKAVKDGFLRISFADGKVKVKVDSKDAIKAKGLTAYYAKKISYSVKVSDFSGKVVGKKVKFTVDNKNYYAKTNKNGVATVKFNLKPGKYDIHVSYGDAKVKSKINVKTTLVTNNVSKNVKKSAKFNVKVLNSKGKAFAKQVVKITFKGKIYKIKTNSKGLASFDIPGNLKVGKHIIKTTCNGLTNTNKIIVRK